MGFVKIGLGIQKLSNVFYSNTELVAFNVIMYLNSKMFRLRSEYQGELKKLFLG